MPLQLTIQNFQQVLNSFSTAELENLVEKSPYFQQAHVLLAKKYQQESNPKFDRQLQLAVLYSQDRELLFNIFREPIIADNSNQKRPTYQEPLNIIPTQKEEVVIEKTESEKIEVASTQDSPPITETLEKEVPPLAKVEEEKAIETVIEEQEIKLVEEPVEIKVEAIEPLQKENEPVEEKTNTVDEPVTLPIVLAAESEQKIEVLPEHIEPHLEQLPPATLEVDEDLNANEKQDEPIKVEAEIGKLELPKTEVEQVNTSNAGDSSTRIEEQELISENKETDAIRVIENKPILPESETPVSEKQPTGDFKSQPHTFEEWLQALQPKPKAEAEPEAEKENEDDELNQLITENVQVDHLSTMVDEETHYSMGLDKFIELQIEKHKQSSVKKPKSGFRKETMDPALITETMAKVYEMQKKYTKAIEAYEILITKYPDKSDYYRVRISYLKNII